MPSYLRRLEGSGRAEAGAVRRGKPAKVALLPPRIPYEGGAEVMTCRDCKWNLGAEQCRLNLEFECREGGGYEAWEEKDDTERVSEASATDE